MRISDWSSDVCSSDLVGGVERQVDAAGPQHRQVEQQGLGRFLDLRGNAVSRLDTAIDEQAREAAGTGLEIGIAHAPAGGRLEHGRSEEHTSELQSLMRISYAVFCLNKKNKIT